MSGATPAALDPLQHWRACAWLFVVPPDAIGWHDREATQQIKRLRRALRMASPTNEERRDLTRERVRRHRAKDRV